MQFTCSGNAVIKYLVSIECNVCMLLLFLLCVHFYTTFSLLFTMDVLCLK